MDSKTITVLFMIVGSTIGGMIPLLWGAGAISIANLIFSALGAMAGIYVGFKMTR